MNTTPTTIEFKGTSYAYDQLYNLGGPELVKIHNQAAVVIGKTPTKRFSDKVSGVKAVWAVLQKAAVQPTAGPQLGDEGEHDDALKGAGPAAEVVTAPEGAGLVATAPSEAAKTAAGPVETPEPPKPGKPAKKAKAPKAPKTPKPPKEKKEREPRGMYFMFPARAVDEQKPVRAGTMRAELFRLLSRPLGASFEQLLEATWGTKKDMDEATQRKTCYEATRLIHYFNGFGMHMDDVTKHIFVWSTKAELADIKHRIAVKHETGALPQ